MRTCRRKFGCRLFIRKAFSLDRLAVPSRRALPQPHWSRLRQRGPLPIIRKAVGLVPTQWNLRLMTKGEALPYHSAGQRPALWATKKIKAESLADYGSGVAGAFVRKAFSLAALRWPLRRALPYAIIRKAFGLVPTQWNLRPMAKGEALSYHREGTPLAQARPMGLGQRPTYRVHNETKAESLVYHSAGQRPALWATKKNKAESPRRTSNIQHGIFNVQVKCATKRRTGFPACLRKAESLLYHSAGQRPALWATRKIKAESLADIKLTLCHSH